MAGETPQMKAALEAAEKRGKAEVGEAVLLNGVPMVKIICSASELIPTQQYANVTVGPISVHRYVPDGDDDHIRAEISRTQQLCEQAVAEERETIQVLMRARAGN